MNKNFILAGIGTLTIAGFLTLTAFGSGKTLEQQKQEIAAAITARLDEFRAQKEEECTAKVTAEAQRRYQEFVAAQPAVSTKPGVKSVKKSKGPAVSPLPQKAPQDPQKTRSGATQPGNTEEQKTRSGAVPTNVPVDVPQQKKRPGAGGGGN